jgi:hypothetical protein
MPAHYGWFQFYTWENWGLWTQEIYHKSLMWRKGIKNPLYSLLR